MTINTTAFRFFFLTYFLILFSSQCLTAETHRLSGRVIDSQTREPLAFVNILIKDTRSGTMTDIDGHFNLLHHSPIEKLALSYVGYYSQDFEVDPTSQTQLILMTKRPIELAVVDVFPGENPAHRIIENVIRFRDSNNPEKLESFTYESYNKFVFTGQMSEEETVPEASSGVMLSVSGNLEGYLADKDLMIIETVTERRFRYPNRNNETVLASRISGFENPVLALIASQFQSFSFYNDYINISGRDYLSPISKGSTNRYFFLLEDTTYTYTDTVFIISFRPSRGRNFEGLSGVLYVNTNNWAIQNVIAEPANQQGQSRVKIQQLYELIDGRHWFPTQLNTDVEIFNVSNVNNLKILGLGRTYIKNITLLPELRRRDFSPYAIEFSPNTIVRDEDFWVRYRTDSLSLRELNTYHFLDSIGREENLDRQLERIEALISGSLRRGYFDFDLNRLIGFNDQEGWRLGFGLSTNPNLSNRFSLHGNINYGFKTKAFRYGWGGEVLLDRPTDLRLGYDFKWDYQERGGSNFLEKSPLLSPAYIRRYFLFDMDLAKQHRIWLNFRTLRNYLTIRTYLSDENLKSNPNYIFFPQQQGETQPEFRFFETGAMMRLAIGEQFVLTPTRTLAFGSNFPVTYLNLAKGWDKVYRGQHDYWKVEMKFERLLRLKLAGTQKWVLQAGYVNGNPPWPKLFTGQATYRRFAIAAPQSFATMRMAEFVSDRYAALFIFHNFENLLGKRNGFSPGLVLLTNIGIGSLSQPQLHAGYELKSMNKGYFESGFAITNLLGSGFTSLGIEFMYRYGPYAFPQFKDNFSLRLNYSFMYR